MRDLHSQSWQSLRADGRRPVSTAVVLTAKPIFHPRPILADERNKAAPWRPPGSPGSVGVVATSVAAAAAASAAIARPAINVHRKRTSAGTPRRSSAGRQVGRRPGFPEGEAFHGGGDRNRDEEGRGYGYGGEFLRSAGGTYGEWLADTRYVRRFFCGCHRWLLRRHCCDVAVKHATVVSICLHLQ